MGFHDREARRTILDKCELVRFSDEEKSDLARNICGMPSSRADTEFVSYRKILAILILIRKQDQIRFFVEKHLDNGLLPLQNIRDSNNEYQLALANSNVRHPCFQG